jgi:hypothetical protein
MISHAELIVGGRTVVKNRTVVGIDLDAARAEVTDGMRHAMRDKASLAAALPLLERAIARHFEPGCF